jgi:hypothetical protein
MNMRLAVVDFDPKPDDDTVTVPVLATVDESVDGAWSADCLVCGDGTMSYTTADEAATRIKAHLLSEQCK